MKIRKVFLFFVVLGVILASSCAKTPAPNVQATAQSMAEQIVKETMESSAPAKESTTEQFPTVTQLPSVIPTQVPTKAAKPRILLYGRNVYSKLQGVALLNNIKLDYFNSESGDSQDMFNNALAEPDVTAAIFGLQYTYDTLIYKLKTFVDHGGHVLFLYNYNWIEENTLFQDLFEISFAREDVVPDCDGIQYTGDMLPSWAQGLTAVVSVSIYRQALRAYLVTPRTDGERRYLISGSTGISRMIYFGSTDRTVTFWPQAEGYSWGPVWQLDFFDDSNIDLLDGTKMAAAMLNYLAGR